MYIGVFLALNIFWNTKFFDSFLTTWKDKKQTPSKIHRRIKKRGPIGIDHRFFWILVSKRNGTTFSSNQKWHKPLKQIFPIQILICTDRQIINLVVLRRSRLFAQSLPTLKQMMTKTCQTL